MTARGVLGAAVLGALAAACATSAPPVEIVEVIEAPPPTPPAREVDWRPYFDDLSKGAILVRLDARRLSYWGPDDSSYREFPVGIAELPEYEKLGRTQIVRRRADPDWRPTPSMRARNPDLPAYMPPGPDNPMGAHALYLGWRYYAIHGTNDPASVGRATTAGCIRLFDEHIDWLYEHAAIGTPVVVVRENAMTADAAAT